MGGDTFIRKVSQGCQEAQSAHDQRFYQSSEGFQRWLPFVKETFNGRGNAVSYLARYLYRSAISNSRIRGYDDSTVTFEYKDYRDGGKTKTMTVSGMEFIRRFLKHVLPSHFNRIRYSGYLTNCRKTFCLKLIHMLRSTVYPGNPYRTMNNAALMMALYHKDICTLVPDPLIIFMFNFLYYVMDYYV